jgi:anti-sigma factor RsiW
MEKAINDFRDRHAVLLTELRRLEADPADDSHVARTRELRSILKVVARSYLREEVDPEVTEEQLREWLRQLEAA